MRIKTVLAAAILTMTPAFAMAEGCSFGFHGQEASMSCAEGTSWDATSGTCVPTVSS